MDGSSSKQGLGARSISQERLAEKENTNGKHHQRSVSSTLDDVGGGDSSDVDTDAGGGRAKQGDSSNASSVSHTDNNGAYRTTANDMKWRTAGQTVLAMDDEDDADSGFLEVKEFLENGRYNSLNYPQEHIKTLMVFVVFILCAWSNWFALGIVHDIAGRTPLPDVVFAVVPEQPWALRVGDSMVTFCMWTGLGVIALHQHRWVILRRGFFVGAILYLCRAISIISTQLPAGYTDNAKSCRPHANKTTFELVFWRFAEQALRVGFQQSFNGYLCGDLLFSGHTLAMALGASLTHYYSPRRLRLVRLVVWAGAALGMVCMIICRTHYTVDVIFGYWMTVGVFAIYHGFCEVPTSARRRSVLYGLWVFGAVAAVERHVPAGRLPNQLEWPFSRPVFAVRLLKGLSDPTPFNGGGGTATCRDNRAARDRTAETLVASSY